MLFQLSQLGDLGSKPPRVTQEVARADCELGSTMSILVADKVCVASVARAECGVPKRRCKRRAAIDCTLRTVVTRFSRHLGIVVVPWPYAGTERGSDETSRSRQVMIAAVCGVVLLKIRWSSAGALGISTSASRVGHRRVLGHSGREWPGHTVTRTLATGRVNTAISHSVNEGVRQGRAHQEG